MPRPAWFKVILSMMLLLSLSSHSTILAQEKPIEDVTAPEIRAVISPMISYQGRLVEDGIPVSGARQMSFSIERTGEVAIWAMPPTMVQVTNGLFQVDLGPFEETVVYQMHQALWLKVQVEGVTLPSQQLLGAPYAFSLAPGAVVQGATTVPMFTASNSGTGIGMVGLSAGSYGIRAISTNDAGFYGTSTNSIGVMGESTNGNGVYALSYAPGIAALYAVSDSPEGIAISTFVSSAKASIVTKNTGSGPLLEGYAGDSDEFVPEFIVHNDGTVQQELGASGLVKVGALVYCAKTDSAIYRQFNNVIGADPITIDNGIVTGTCHIDPGFDLSNSYWVVSNPDPTPHIISCAMDYTDTLWCTRFDTTGNVVDGRIMLLIY